MNTEIIDKIVKRRDDPNKKASFLGKVSVWGIVIGCGLVSRTLLQLQKEERQK